MSIQCGVAVPAYLGRLSAGRLHHAFQFLQQKQVLLALQSVLGKDIADIMNGVAPLSGKVGRIISLYGLRSLLILNLPHHLPPLRSCAESGTINYRIKNAAPPHCQFLVTWLALTVYDSCGRFECMPTRQKVSKHTIFKTNRLNMTRFAFIPLVEFGDLNCVYRKSHWHLFVCSLQSGLG